MGRVSPRRRAVLAKSGPVAEILDLRPKGPITRVWWLWAGRVSGLGGPASRRFADAVEAARLVCGNPGVEPVRRALGGC